MRDTRLIMGMPITIEVIGANPAAAIESAFDYFVSVDQRFSPYKTDSELSAMNRGEITGDKLSDDMQQVLALCELTRSETNGYFDIRRPDGSVDTSGLVKGWAIRNAARLITAAGHKDFFVEAGGDIQCAGLNDEGQPWRVGIRNPFNDTEIVKALVPGDRGVATSGLYVRGNHIYDPLHPDRTLDEIVSLTVLGPDIYEADRFATAAFAMGRDGIGFIEATHGLEGYAIDPRGIATMTSGFKQWVSP